MKTETLPGDILQGDSEGSLPWWKQRRRQHIDWCIVWFCILGAALVGITVLAIANMATAELANPAHLIEVATSSEV
ncbi:MAG: Molybdate/tungstate transport system permease protein wtpB, partial [Methanoculleus marisnigri]